MQKDYHTHTFRCRHAAGDVMDYAKAAVEKDATVLGISDHTPLPDGKWSTIRMDLTELEAYVKAIEEAQKNYTNLLILKGMECDYAPEYHSFYQEELLGKWNFAYLIAGTHFFPYQDSWLGVHSYIRGKEELFAYTDQIIASISSGLFTFVAHPDLFANSYLPWDENTIACSHAILQAAADQRIPLEINGNGFRKPQIETAEGLRYVYPIEPFWELAAQYDLSVIVNSDAHSPADVLANIAEGLALAKKYRLKLADLSFLEN